MNKKEVDGKRSTQPIDTENHDQPKSKNDNEKKCRIHGAMDCMRRVKNIVSGNYKSSQANPQYHSFTKRNPCVIMPLSLVFRLQVFGVSLTSPSSHRLAILLASRLFLKTEEA